MQTLPKLRRSTVALYFAYTLQLCGARVVSGESLCLSYGYQAY